MRQVAAATQACLDQAHAHARESLAEFAVDTSDPGFKRAGKVINLYFSERMMSAIRDGADPELAWGMAILGLGAILDEA